MVPRVGAHTTGLLLAAMAGLACSSDGQFSLPDQDDPNGIPVRSNLVPGEFCIDDDQCYEGFCFTVSELYAPGAGDQEDAIDTDEFEPGFPDGGGFEEIGVCLRRCTTVFECPEADWVCALDLGVCIPEQFAR